MVSSSSGASEGTAEYFGGIEETKGAESVDKETEHGPHEVTREALPPRSSWNAPILCLAQKNAPRRQAHHSRHRFRNQENATRLVPGVSCAPCLPSRNVADPLLPPKRRWVCLKTYDWVDQEGNNRKWEVASRTTTAAGGVDGSELPCPLSAVRPLTPATTPFPPLPRVAVALVALLKHPSRPLSLPIILQYRAPTESVCVELPAGLIDKGETTEEAGIRELHEETGALSPSAWVHRSRCSVPSQAGGPWTILAPQTSCGYDEPLFVWILFHPYSREVLIQAMEGRSLKVESR